MQQATAEWVAKAEGDFTTALREYRHSGESATREAARDAITTCKALREEARRVLSLSV